MPESGLLIVGSGGFGREAAQAAADGGFSGPVLGFLDDDPALAGREVAGHRVLGPVADLHEYPHAKVLVATGRPDAYTSRAAIVDRLDLPADRFATVVHPAAHLAGDTRVGPGCVILAGVVCTAGVRIGAHVAVMPHVVLTHDVQVADFATLASGVALAGGVQVGEGAYLGAATSVRQELTIGEWALTGMGSLVLTDVPAHRMWFGSPAVDRGPAPATGFERARGRQEGSA